MFLAIIINPLFSQLTITGIGKYDLVAPGGLSGLTWANSDQYYAIADSGGMMYPVAIHIDSTTGAITSASIGSPIGLSDGSDLEGIAYNPQGNGGAGSVYISDEVGPAIREHSLDGALINTLATPSVYTTGRLNRSLESLTRQGNGSTIWTANEEALANDGPVSTFSAGTVVRLQRFVRSESGYVTNGQWAYETEKIAHDNPFVTGEVSGVSDLSVLPNGQLLVLERQVTGSGSGFNLPEFRNAIYGVDFSGATDVSALEALDGATYTQVAKTLLWSGTFALSNYEGLSLGIELADGSYSLLMISDGDDEPDEDLYALTIAGDIELSLPSCRAADLAGEDDMVNFLDVAVFAEDFGKIEFGLDADIDRDGDCDSTRPSVAGDLLAGRLQRRLNHTEKGLRFYLYNAMVSSLFNPFVGLADYSTRGGGWEWRNGVQRVAGLATQTATGAWGCGRRYGVSGIARLQWYRRHHGHASLGHATRVGRGSLGAGIWERPHRITRVLALRLTLAFCAVPNGRTAFSSSGNFLPTSIQPIQPGRYSVCLTG